MLERIFHFVKKHVIYRINVKRYKKWHLNSLVIKPMIISGKDCVAVGDNVRIMNNARIEAIKRYGGVEFTPNIEICDGVTIQQNVHITCANSVIIGRNTGIVSNVTITDIIHPYTEKKIHPSRNPIVVKHVCIGEYCSIYSNVVILAGVNIGNHVTIGANSVVTHDIPDYCLAVGSPAIIIKRYNFETKRWEKTDKDGNFLPNR